jgi:hypothetical protein
MVSAFCLVGKRRRPPETQKGDSLMTDKTIRNKAEIESGQMAESNLLALPGGDKTTDLGGTSRRNALAILAKHTAYTAPAVLAILSLTTKQAAAGSF